MTLFKDLCDLVVPDWAINPSLSDDSSAHQNLHEETNDLQNLLEAKIHFKLLGYEAFWLAQNAKIPKL